MQFEDEIKDRYDYKQLKKLNYVEKDEIDHYYVFDTERGEIFVSLHKDISAWPKFEHEINSLEQIRKTNTIYAPKPIGLIGDIDSNGAALITEFIKVNESVDWKLAGKELAELHHHNYVTMKREQKRQQWVGGLIARQDGIIDEEPQEYFEQFGFIDSTIGAFYGKNEFVNVWHDNWPEFFSRHRLEPQFRRVINYFGDRHIIELWSNLQTQLEKFFLDTPKIVPSLLHGDLGNDKIGFFKKLDDSKDDNYMDDGNDERAKEIDKCILLEPISFYGHSEFDLAKVKLNPKNDFPIEFYEEYHKKIKKQQGFELRSKLYQLFFALNNYKKNENLIKSLIRELLK